MGGAAFALGLAVSAGLAGNAGFLVLVVAMVAIISLFNYITALVRPEKQEPNTADEDGDFVLQLRAEDKRPNESCSLPTDQARRFSRANLTSKLFRRTPAGAGDTAANSRDNETGANK